MVPWHLCVLFLQFEENRSETRSYSPAASQHSDYQLSRYQVQLCPPTCLTCRDPCQAEPEFTQMLIHTDPESTGITSHMWWNGGNNFHSLHYSSKGLTVVNLLSNLRQKFPDCIYKPQDWTQFLVSSAIKKQVIGFGKLTVLMGYHLKIISIFYFFFLWYIYKAGNKELPISLLS